jgi:peptidoglycan/LPS O-acetylase OafA/YrhL
MLRSDPSIPSAIASSDAASPPGRGAIIGLDFIRFGAALGVVVYHYAFYSWHEPMDDLGVRAAIGTPVAFPGLVSVSWWGWVGVQIFFVISGLVICVSAERQSAAAFLRNRFLRLAPALWVFATLSLIVTFLHSSVPASELLVMYVRSVALFPQGPWIDGVYWTLTIEAVFYAATLLLIATGWFAHLRLIACAASFVILGFYLLAGAARIWSDMPLAGTLLAVADAYVSRVILLTTGCYFLVGIQLYLIDRDGWSLPSGAGFGASLVAGAIALWLSAQSMVAAFSYETSPMIPVVVWLVVVGLIALALRHDRTGRGSARLGSFARSVGLSAYPLYLFHNIAGAFLFGMLLRTGMPSYSALGAAILVCVAVSAVFARWLEPVCRQALMRRLDRLAKLASRSRFIPGSAKPDRSRLVADPCGDGLPARVELES